MLTRQIAMLATCGAMGLVAACTHDAPAKDGQLVVLVTLSRTGGVGPSFDHVPQPDEVVRVIDTAGHKQTASTDSDGEAEFVLAPGDYGVTADFCPNGPVPVTISADKVSRAAVDCVAP
jgi:hypothetical protein